jgi:hypothetical protein
MSELEALVARVAALTGKIDFWNAIILWATGATVLAGAILLASQKIGLNRAKELSNVQDRIATIKEREAKVRTDELENSNLKLRNDLQQETANVARLQKDASDARERQQKVEIQLTTQQQRAVAAESDLAKLKERVAWRTVSEEQKKNFLTKVAGAKKGSIKMLAPDGDAEAVTYASEMLALLTSAGWVVVPQTMTPIGSTPIGVFFVVPRSGDLKPDDPLYHVAQLQQALLAIGIPSNVEENKNMGESDAVIWVGHKPKPVI